MYLLKINPHKNAIMYCKRDKMKNIYGIKFQYYPLLSPTTTKNQNSEIKLLLNFSDFKYDS